MQRQLSMLTAREMEIKMNYARQINIKFPHKPRSWLAYKLRKEKGSDIKVSRKKYCTNINNQKF